MSEDSRRKVLLVGHCTPDVFMLRNAIRSAVEGVEAPTANSDEELATQVASAELLLVNRALDGSFSASDGIELIREILARPEPPAVMLISDRPEAQAEAEAAGARPGFGKSRLYDPLTKSRLRAAIEGTAATWHPS